MDAVTGVEAENRSSEVVPSNDDEEQSEVQTGSTALPSAWSRKTQRSRNAQGEWTTEASADAVAAPQPTQSSAARWDADSEMATFDWPNIEQVAATNGPNQVMAKLLLAARAEGANSRWPF